MKRKNYLLMTLAASSFLLASCYESEEKSPEPAIQEAVAPANTAAGSPLTGIYCKKTEFENTTLAILETEEHDLRFALNKRNVSDGHSCGMINPTAKKQSDSTWIYIDSEQSESKCTIEIEFTEKAVRFSNTAGDCSKYCGFNVMIGQDNEIPRVDESKNTVTEETLTGLYENDSPCQ